jgi:hypothetical protein
VSLSLQPAELGRVPLPNQKPDLDGKFTFNGVSEGHFRFSPSVTSASNPIPASAWDSYVEDIRMGSVSVYDRVIDFGAAQPAPFEIFLKANGGRIAGTVVDVQGNPAARVAVVLVPPVSRRQNPTLYKTVSTDATGNFTLRGIAPGQYKLFAWQSVPVNAYQNSTFLAKYEERGQPLTVAAGTTTNAQVRLIPSSGGN